MKNNLIETRGNKLCKHIAQIIFFLFLVVIFLNAFYPQDSRMDLDNLKDGYFFIFNGFTYQAYPLLPVILYSLLPEWIFILLSPFAIVVVYLLLYYLVSENIIYLFPFTLLIPLFYSTLLPGTFDWLFLPCVYYFIRLEKNNRALIFGTLMVYIHAQFSLIYLTILLSFLRKWDMLKKIILFSLPQMIPLIYFSRQFIFEGFNRFPWPFVVKLFNHEITRFTIDGTFIRILIILLYSLTFLTLVHLRKKVNYR